MIARCVPLALFAFAALLTSCRKPAIESYRTPKEVTSTPPAESAGTAESKKRPPGDSSMANTPVATAGGPGLTWTAPAHWKSKSGPAVRKASFAIGEGGEGDLSITAFPGDAGGELANLNRWRGQQGIELPPISQAELEANTQHLDRNELHMTVVDIAGKGPNALRTLGAMIPYGGATWFVKLMGPEPIIAKEKPAFMAFLDTIKPAPAAK